MMKKHKRLTILVLLVVIFLFILLIVVIIQKSPLYLYAKYLNVEQGSRIDSNTVLFLQELCHFHFVLLLDALNCSLETYKKDNNSKSPLHLVIYVKLKVPGSSAKGFS